VSQLKVIMLSAMYENGGNTTHRMLDGHPELFVYPFESQVGTSVVNDYLSSYVPFRYRWPEFPLEGDASADYELFFDEELKTFTRVPNRSKFKGADLQIDEAERKRIFVESMAGRPRTRANLVHAFFKSTFDAWKNVQRTGREQYYVGYNPVQVLDAEKMLADFPDGHMIHVVRNPYSGFADTSKRPWPLSLERYTWTWTYCQLLALTFAEKYPDRFHVVRFEDIVADPAATFGTLCDKLGIGRSDTCLYPSWNGQKMEQVYPWGTVRTPTIEANIATANELTDEQKDRIRALSIVMLRPLGYEDFSFEAPSRRQAA
jgi:hypothetical protein